MGVSHHYRGVSAPIHEANLLGDANSGRNLECRYLQLLLQRAREGRVSTVNFSKVDRIGRNARDSLNIVHELRRCGVRMIVLDPRLDTSDPFGYFLYVILAAAAELESTQIVECTMGGRMEMLDQTSAARLPAIRQLVTRIWADREGWELAGCLPGLDAEVRACR